MPYPQPNLAVLDTQPGSLDQYHSIVQGSELLPLFVDNARGLLSLLGSETIAVAIVHLFGNQNQTIDLISQIATISPSTVVLYPTCHRGTELLQRAKKAGAFSTPDRKKLLQFDTAPEILESAIQEHQKRKERDATGGFVTFNRLLLSMLRRFSVAAGTLQLRRKGKQPFPIQDEYDVQELLYVALRMVFDDVMRESPTPLDAGAFKKVDLYIPSLRHLVEIKVVRDAKHATKVAEEIKVDIESYYKHENLSILVAYIYDPQRRIRNPQVVENDLSGVREIRGVRFDVVAIVAT